MLDTDWYPVTLIDCCSCDSVGKDGGFELLSVTAFPFEEVTVTGIVVTAGGFTGASI